MYLNGVSVRVQVRGQALRRGGHDAALSERIETGDTRVSDKYPPPPEEGDYCHA